MTKKVTATDFDGHQHEIETSKLTWRPSAYGVVIQDNKILLLKQTNGYDLPGGGMDLGETPEDAVLREVKEETGLTVVNPKLLGLGNSYYIAFGTTGVYRHSLMIYYKCDYVGGELSDTDFDESEQKYAIGPEWVALEKLDDLKIGSTNDFRPYIKQALK